MSMVYYTRKYKGHGLCEAGVDIEGNQIILCKKPATLVYFYNGGSGALLCQSCYDKIKQDYSLA